MSSIIIDPGHGGVEPKGKSSPYGARGHDGRFEKSVNYALATRVVELLGPDAALTRQGDENRSLNERIAAARQGRAAAFLSLHAHPGSGPSEVWVHSRANPEAERLGGSVLAALGGSGGGLRRGELAVLDPGHHAPGTAACLVETDLLASGGRGLDQVAGALAAGVQRFLGATYGRGLPVRAQFGVLAPPAYDPSSSDESMRSFLLWQENFQRFVAGVPRAAHEWYPHNAICKLILDGAGHGSGFYIGGNKLLTAGHCLSGVSKMRILPGQAGNNYSNPATIDVDSSRFRLYPGYAPAGGTDLGVVLLPDQHPLRARSAFRPQVLDRSPGTGLLICGYAAEITNEDRNNVQLSFTIDPWVQHFSSGGFAVDAATPDLITAHINITRGTSGSPTFFVDQGVARAVGVLVAYGDGTYNTVCALTPAKLTWIHAQS